MSDLILFNPDDVRKVAEALIDQNIKHFENPKQSTGHYCRACRASSEFERGINHYNRCPVWVAKQILKTI